MTSHMSITNSNDNYSQQSLPLSIRNSSAVDDIVVQTNPHTTSDIVVQATGDVVLNIPSMVSDHADSNGLTAVGCQAPTVPPLEGKEGAMVEGSLFTQKNRIPIDPKLYNAAVKGDVKLLQEFLQSQDLQQLDGPSPLDGVTIGDNTVLHIAATSSCDLTSLLKSCKDFAKAVYFKNRSLLMARKGDYVDYAEAVCFRNRSLLMARNRLKETPLHCAVKAGNIDMVSCLISFATEEGQSVKQSLITARNMHGETALHEAVRVGHKEMVENLIESEPSLTGIVDAEGVSPLYLATMMNALNIVEIFTKEEPSRVSCGGPKGQTALHAAVLEHSSITRELLKWNNSLATKVDDSKSTPLHYAASVGNLETVQLLLGDDEIKKTAYMADNKGLFPIHIAAQCGRALIIKELMEQFPDSDELLDKEGRNFLHLAILSGKGNIISIIYNHTFLRMLNARDYQGNTPLHLASESGDIGYVRLLISMKMVYSSIMNRDGLTPVDLALKEVEGGPLIFVMGKKLNILRCMMWTGALPSPRQFDHLSDYLIYSTKDKKGDTENVESIIRNLVITSILIATVTFAACFTMPGGYIADDHAINRGSPILSRKYAFKAFIVADLLAFLSSMLATALLIYAGSANVDIKLRTGFLFLSMGMVQVAVQATMCAFSLALYTMLYQVNFAISILACVATFGFISFGFVLPYLRVWSLARPTVMQVGWKGLFKSHLRPPTLMRIKVRPFIIGRNLLGFFFSPVALNICLYVLIFLLALI